MLLSRFFPAGLAVLALSCVLPAAHAQTKAFNDTFTGASTVNANPTSPAAPAVTAASYQQIAAKVFNPKPPVITSGNLRFGIVATSSGFNHVQALFTQYPVKLVNVGDYIELTVNFSSEGGILTAQTNSTLFFGLFNASQIQPIPGGIENSTAAVAGYAQTWQGYVNRIFYAGGNNGFFSRPAQTDIAANNQDVLYNYAGSATVGSTAVSSLTTPVANDPYTEVFRITKASATTLTLSSSLYAGASATGTPIYTQTNTSSNTLTDTFDAFAFGWRATGSVASVMNVSAVRIETTGTTTIVPEILTQPFSLTKMIGESVSFTVEADGGNGTELTYQWRKDEVDIPGATAASYEIASVALSDAGDYSVVVSNIAGSTTSDTATLTVTTEAVPPSIVTDPVGATLLVGESHTFTITANGTAPLTYQWQKSTDGGSSFADLPGATTTSHTIASATLADAGLYRAVVTNGQGSSTSAAAALEVHQAPVITTQPTGATVDPGAMVTLTVVATGTPSPTYQWKKNGADIAGATSDSYTIASASGADAGNYTVVVSNSVDSTTSAVAAVAVRSATMTGTSFTPSTGATSLNRDLRLSITFNEPVSPGVSGLLRIHDSADNSVVDTIDLSAATALRDTLRAASTLSTQLLPVQKKPIGGLPNDFNYYPITVDGATATLHLRNNVLAYGKTYYVTVEPGVFVNASGETFSGINDSTTWRFSTKAAGPAAGATLLTVAADGSGDFDTLQGAIDFVPAGNTTPTTIFLKTGTYFELVGFQQKHNLTLLGEDAATTILTYPNNNTFNTASGVYHRSVMVAHSVRDLTVANLTIHNTTPQNGSQAEAIVINGPSPSASRNLVTRCRFYSYQDTVQFNKQTYISDSIIDGDVDFLWGDGPAYFENCDIRILRSNAYFTQIRNGSGNHGYVFRNCRFTAPAGITGTFFGRIDPTNFPFSEVVILDSSLGSAENNAFLASDTGVSGSNYRAGWWLLNNATSAASAPNVHNWSNTLVDANGAPIANPNADAFTTMPLDATTQANYRDPVWVLNTSMSGVVNGSWTPALAPLLVRQPADATVNAGDSVTLSVDVIAIPAASYQWRKNGADIAGATSATYSIAAAAAGHAGSYTVVVTNTAGSATSAAATVVVASPEPVALVDDTFTDMDRIGGADGSNTTNATPSISAPTATNTQWVVNRTKQLVASATGMQWTFDSTGSVMALGYFPAVNVGPTAVTLKVDFTTGTSGVGPGNNLRIALIDDTESGRRTTDGFGASDAAYVGDVGYGFFSGSTIGGGSTANLSFNTLKRQLTTSSNLLGTGTDWGSALGSSSGATGYFEPNTAYSLELTLSHVGDTLSIQTRITGGNLSGLDYTVTDSSDPVRTFNTLALRFGTGSNQFSGIRLTGFRVTQGTGNDAPVVTASPASQTVVEGDNATFSVVAVGSPAPTYQWFKDGAPLANGGRISGAMSDTLTLTGVLPSDAGSYTAEATNSAGSDTSAPAVLTVASAAPSITTQPLSQTVNAGTAVAFSVTATGATPFTYQWYKDGQSISDAMSASYTIASAGTGDAGSYTVVVSNDYGLTTSDPAILTVNAGETGGIVVDDTLADGDSQNENFATGSLRIFNGRAENIRTDAPGSVTFTHNTTGADGVWAFFTAADAPISLAVGERLTVDVGFSVNGFVGTGQDIRFGVLNSAGTRNTTNLTGGMNQSTFADDLGYAVRYIASGSSAPFSLIKRLPVGSTATPNNPFNTINDWAVVNTNASGPTEITPLVDGVSYTLTYEIFRQSETNTLLTVLVSGGNLPASYGRIATDTDTTVTSFDYFGFRTASSGFASSITFTRFTVAVERTPPEIITQPTFANGSSAQSLPVGGITTVSVGVNGSDLEYQWYRDGQPIEGATAATLDLFNVQTSDAGAYTVVVSNTVGSTTSEAATLTVTGGEVAPTIVTAPESQIAAEGSPVSFFVDAVGTTPFSYQWYKDGGLIGGATSASYTIASAAFGDAGDYTAVVTNSVGSATSSAATLTVRGIASIQKTGFAADVTGGAAGATVIVSTPAELRAYAEDLTTPYTIVVNGTIDLGLNGRVRLRSNKTLRGATTSSTILGTITISNADNVIVSNLNISADTGEPSVNDGVTIASSTRVLVTKCTIFNCTDGNLDVINGSDLVTISWCKFYYTRNNGHNFSNLVGSSDTDVGSGDGRTNYRVTWHHNWWAEGGKQRMIACRFGQAHMFNNYWSCVGNDYATESRNVASVLSEYNYYHGVNHPLAKRTATVTDVGLLMTIGNVFDSCSGRQETGSDEMFTPPYSYAVYATGSLPALVMAGAGNVTEPSPVFGSATIDGPSSPVLAGGTATLTAAPAGFSPVSYQWRRNNFALDGATSATLEFSNLDESHSGTYTVVLGLADGDSVVSAPFVLTVVSATAPTITADPAAQTATVGDTVTFTVTASGTAPLTYQWRKDGGDLLGATSASLELTSLTTSAAGEYDCVVSNIAGSATSAAATLTVNPAVASVAVTSASTTYDGSAKSLVITTTPAGLPLTVTYDGASSAPTNAGSYAVQATVVHPDYIGSGSGTLVILPAAAAVNLTNLAHTYDGSPKAAAATTTPSGVPVSLTYDGSPDAPINAGSYTVIGTVTDPNYTGSASGTLVIDKAIATIALAPLSQHYDGKPKSVVATPSVAGLTVNLTYDGDTQGPIYPGPHAVVATIDDDNYQGAASDTLVITISALARRVSTINGELDGSLQVLLAENVTLSGSAMVSGDLLVPGTPSLRLNGHPTFGGTVDGPGAETPTGHTVTLGGGTVLRKLVQRVDPIALPSVAMPPAPTGTRDVVITNNRQTVNFTNLRNLTLNGGAGKVMVPAGTYGTFVANGSTGFVLGVAGTATPTVYNLQSLALNGSSTLQVVGPVILNLANGTVINGTAGPASNPEWLDLRAASGDVTLNAGAKLRAWVTAPAGAVSLGDGAVLLGRVTSDSLTINLNALLDDPTP